MSSYKSGFERSIALNLASRKVKFGYETVELKYTLDGTYHPDFILENGIIVEAKGLLDDASKRKMIAVKKQHPEKDIRFLFMNADKKIPHSKQTHGIWAAKNGFKFAEGVEIPQEWIDE